MPNPPGALLRLHLSLAAIGEKVGTGDEAGLVRGQEQGYPSDLFRVADPAERHAGSKVVEQPLLLRLGVTSQIKNGLTQPSR